MIQAFIYGVVLAFGLITPLGIQNVFLFNQGALQPRWVNALPSVITAGICDTLVILASILGLSVVVLHIPWLKTLIFIIGFFFLLYMGWIIWNSHPPQIEKSEKPFSTTRQIIFAMSVSLLNPHAIIDSLGVIGTNSLHFTGDAKIAYTAACILVSWGWFFGLITAGHVMHRVTKNNRWLIILNKIAAIIMWIVAGYIGWQVIISFR